MGTVSAGKASTGGGAEVKVPVSAELVHPRFSARVIPLNKPIELKVGLHGFPKPPASVDFAIKDGDGKDVETVQGKVAGREAKAKWKLDPAQLSTIPAQLYFEAKADSVTATSECVAVEQCVEAHFEPGHGVPGKEVKLKIKAKGFPTGTAVKITVFEDDLFDEDDPVESLDATLDTAGRAEVKWTIPKDFPDDDDVPDAMRREIHADSDAHGETTAAIQHLLKALSDKGKAQDPGEANNVMTRKTADAIKAFKQSNGVEPADEAPTRPFIDKLVEVWSQEVGHEPRTGGLNWPEFYFVAEVKGARGRSTTLKRPEAIKLYGRLGTGRRELRKKPIGSRRRGGPIRAVPVQGPPPSVVPRAPTLNAGSVKAKGTPS